MGETDAVNAYRSPRDDDALLARRGCEHLSTSVLSTRCVISSVRFIILTPSPKPILTLRACSSWVHPRDDVSRALSSSFRLVA